MLDVHTYDMARVEALSGPQGTLYGASSLAGTVRLIFNKPEIGKTYGGYDLGLNKFGKGDIRSPFDFEAMAKLVRPEDFEGRMVISADPDVHRAEIQRYVDLGFDRIYLHNVGRNQREWIEVFGRDVLPALHR